MFGLMKRAPRMTYCGTCKSIGAIYGHRSRIFLNHDVVFLAEVLMDGATEHAWTHAFRSFNCLSLPKSGDPIPIALQYGAAINIVLAHFHIADHRADSKSLKWRAASRWISPAYRRAAARLRAWDFPMDELAAILGTQTAREAAPLSLAHVAEPTALATAMVLTHGARLTGRPERAATLERVGARFGYIVYVLDAYEDRARDAASGDFNPLEWFPEVSAPREILAALAEIEPEIPRHLADRLRANVEERLGLRPRVLSHTCRRFVNHRWRDAVAFARALREREQPGFFKGAAVLASTALLAYLFPHHVRQTASWRECLGLPMNLMALGSVFAAAAPPPPPPEPPPQPPGGFRPFNPRPATPSPQTGVSNVRPGWCCCLESCGEGCAEGCCDSICDAGCDCS